MATKAVKASDEVRVAEVELSAERSRPRGDEAAAGEEVARLRAALVAARATLMAHGFDISAIDQALA